MTNKPELWCCLYDIHFPQYDQKTFRAILSFIRQNHVDGLLLGGDALDLGCVSHWNANLPGTKRKGELKSDLDGFDKEILQPIEALLPRSCQKVFLTGNHERMLDQDLSGLYNVPTKRLNEQVKRNIGRFPADFMFQLTHEEFENLKSQIATSSWGGRRVPPYAFTEHGVLMLSSVLNSERAINVNIQIMRIYTKMREMLMAHQEILIKLDQLEKQTLQNTEDIQVVFAQLKQFLIPIEQAERRWIGFRRPGEEE